jgi:hypothetical protein
MATKQYKRAGKSISLCPDCHDKLCIQNMYERNLLRISQYEKNKEYDMAHSLLGNVRVKTAKRDHDGLLNYTINNHEGMLLEEQGKVKEALEVHRNNCPVDAYGYINNKIIIAKILIQVNQSQNAIHELSAGIMKAREAEYFLAFNALYYYANEARKASLGIPFDIYERFIEISKYYGVYGDKSSYVKKEAYNNVINSYSLYMNAQLRFSKLLDEIKYNVENSVDIDRQRIVEYIKKESNSYYKYKAQQVLIELEANRNTETSKKPPTPSAD